MNRTEALDRLLMDRFTRDELRLFLRYGSDDEALLHALPAGDKSDVAWFSEVALTLERWGLVDGLWDRLRAARPHHRAEIDAVAALWSAPHGPSLLKSDEILAVADAITDAGLLRKRDALLAGIDRAFVERIPQSTDRAVQCTHDVRALAQQVDGELLRGWFDRALALAHDAHDALRALKTVAVGRAVTGAYVDETCSLTDRNPLVRYWDRFEGELQAAFSLASSQCRRDNAGKPGEPILETRYVFIALRRILPDPLGQLFARLPREAIDPPIESEIRLDLQVVTAPLWPSGCVRDALGRLARLVPPNRYITPADLFIDLARFGTGDSVKQLRRFGVTAEVIEDHVRALGIAPVLTSGGHAPPDGEPLEPAV